MEASDLIVFLVAHTAFKNLPLSDLVFRDYCGVTDYMHQRLP